MTASTTPDLPAAEPPPPSSTGIKASALRASAWTIGAMATNNIVRLISNIILTRLLFPEVFGLSALVTIFLQGLAMFSDVGIGPSIIQNPRGDDPRFLKTAWTIQCGRGFALWVCSWIIAAPLAAYYKQPLLIAIIPAAGLSAIFGGFDSTAWYVQQRHLKIGLITLAEQGSSLFGMLVTILLAILFRRHYGANDLRAVWAVIIGGLAGSAAHLLLGFTVLPHIRHRFCLDRSALTALINFGRWVFFSTVLTFFAAQTDRLLFGKMISIEQLGVYNIALMLAMVPIQLTSMLGSKVLFPAYSRLTSREDFSSVLLRARRWLLIGSALIITGLVASGPFFIRMVYDNRYEAAGWIVQYLAVAAWFQVLETANHAELLAHGRVNWIAAGSAVKFLSMLVLLPLGLHWGGFSGALLGLVISDVLKYIPSTVGAASLGMRGFRMDSGFTLGFVASSCVAFLAGYEISKHLGAIPAFLVAGSLATLIWGIPALLLFQRERQDKNTANPAVSG